MQKTDIKTIRHILNLLTQFLKGQSDIFLDEYRTSPKIFHYYHEIVRYWSKINFIIQKTLTSLKQQDLFNERNFLNEEKRFHLMATYFYATYRIIWEFTPLVLMIDELNEFTNNSNKKNFPLFLKQLQTFNWKLALKEKSTVERLSIEEAIPTYVIEHLLPVMSLKFLKANLHFMNNATQYTHCTLRFNTLRLETNEENIISHIQEDLKQSGIHLQQDPEIPELFHVPIEKRSIILRNKWYQAGYLIFQDKASALVVKVLNPKPNEFICDMCAAPGMKTSLIAQNTANQARIVAVDIHKTRMYQMKNLLKHLHTSNAYFFNADSYNLPIKPEHKFDRILVDAPCSGTGTFYTNPLLKWRQNQQFLEQNRYFQSRILESALQILKPTGILVYSTCSLYSEEGELQMMKFLDRLKPLKLFDWLSPSYKIGNKIVPGTGRLFPAIHKTQGFFIGKFEKIR